MSEKNLQQHMAYLASEVKAIKVWAEQATNETLGYVEDEVFYRIRKLKAYAKENNVPFMADGWDIIKELDYDKYVEEEDSSSYYEDESSWDE